MEYAVTTVFFLLMALVRLTTPAPLVTSVELEPPVLVEAKHISLNAIRLIWSLDHINISDVTLSTDVALATNKCDDPEQHVELQEPTQEWVFWDVSVGVSYLACVRTVLEEEKVSEWVTYSVSPDARRPPMVTRFGIVLHHSLPEGESASRYVYVKMEPITIECIAGGLPSPAINWTKEGEPIEGEIVERSKDYIKSVVRVDAADKDTAGVYACTAENAHGRAQSSTLYLQEAVLQPFQADAQDKLYKITTGESMKLECSVPYSVPKAHVSWSRIKSRSDRNSRPVRPDFRVNVGDDGSLLFVYTIPTDQGMYRCDVHNTYLGEEELGSYSNLTLSGKERYKIAPTLLSSSSEHLHGLVGGSVVIKCIFGGRPAPNVLWYRTGGFPASRHSFGDHNHTLTITDIRREDEGQYECVGANSEARSGPKTFVLLVYAAPTWVIKPVSLNVTSGDDAEFGCDAEGVPSPQISWYINGDVLLEEHLPESWSFENNGRSLVLRNVSKSDLLSVQCNASNIHGFIYTDAYLNVVAPTEILTAPSDQVLEVHTVVQFLCEVTADPGTILTVTWLRAGQPIAFEQDRIYVKDTNILVINTTNEEDGGLSFLSTYTCRADNGLVAVEASAKLRPPPELIPTESRLSPVRDATSNKLKDIIWIGLICGLTVIVVMCMMCLFVMKKKQTRLPRSGTDTSILSYLSTQGRVEEERRAEASPLCTYCPTTCPPASPELPTVPPGHSTSDDAKLPALRYLDGAEGLHQALQDVFIARDRLELGHLVGKGQFGRVYAGTFKDVKKNAITRIAVKTLKYKPDETEIVELFLREALLMKDFRHAHVLKLIGISVDDDGSPMVILPFMANGDLRRYIQDPEKEITVLELLKMGLQVARGMVYLSNRRFVHRDLAARNCMVDSHKVVKVADFGLSRELFYRDYYRIGDDKTPLPVRWMAPESLKSSVFTTQSDVWSFGVVLWELMTRGAVPYPDIDNRDIGQYISSGKRLSQPMYCPDSVFEIMRACWEESPDDRPGFEMICKDIECIVNSARTPDKCSSHLYLNIGSATPFTDYREAAI